MIPVREGDHDMKMPFEKGFRVTSPYGYRIDPITGAAAFHGGIDLVGLDAVGAPARDMTVRDSGFAVRAVVGGTVVQSRIVTDSENRTSEWGNYIAVFGTDGRLWYYCHLASRAVGQGVRVEEGQILGTEGMTGRATGVHLHLEVRAADNKTTLDPAEMLGIRNAAGTVWTPPDAPEQPEELEQPGQPEEPEQPEQPGGPHPSAASGHSGQRAPAPWEQQSHDWGREAVAWAIGRGILRGRGGGDYALGEPVTREELCVMLWRAREVL